LFKLIPNFSLKDNNSFGLDVRAGYWLTINSLDGWCDALARYPHLAEEERMIIGGGTNLLFVSDFDGLIISPDFCGFEITYQDSQWVEISVGAGEIWDDFVAYCVVNQWYGIENLSLIPGKVGAAAVQNIGAYGAEISSVIVRVNGIDLDSLAEMSYPNDQCQFRYRSSLFKEQLSNRFMVTSVVFRLQKQGVLNSGYGDLKRVLAELGEPDLEKMRKAVIQIRSSKLPDPKLLGNAGSFFKNPILTEEVADALADLLPGLPIYQLSDGYVKVGAGFLIEKAGWKGRHWCHAAVHDRQALVLINRGGATGHEILQLSEAIQKDVFEKFGVALEREVQVVGSAK
jgi:UDP-N-acetylmuramate dehydrogenase